eukprot:Seg961.4 transcript_id=Seg961.4/GoldUCD/mRNA.D3Y31 product="hypothetical protein" protein_id=Seg961.4/GoldUCD/D3Y31
MNKKWKKFVKMACEDISKQIVRFSKSLVTECKVDDDEKTNCDELTRLNLMEPKTGDDELSQKSKGSDDEAEKLEKNESSDDDVIRTRLCCLVDSGLNFIKPFIDVFGTSSHLALDYVSDEQLDMKAILFR